jgi:dTDP-4-amino-4,6-dideoxy-D-galactose acyltransferase
MQIFKHLDWDTNFFGYPIASLLINNENVNLLPDALSTLKDEGYRLIYWKVEPTNVQFNSLAKQYGGQLVDEKLHFGMHLESNYTFDSNVVSYPVGGVLPVMYNLAVQTGEYSRYRVDENISESLFTALYRKWIENSVARLNAEEVLIYVENNNVMGMVTLSTDEMGGVIGLIGVDHQFRDKGAGQKLVQATCNYFKNKNIDFLSVITQKANIPACNFYRKCGFEVFLTENVYHFWL